MRNFILEIITVIFGGNNIYLIAVDEQRVMISRSALAPRLEVSSIQLKCHPAAAAVHTNVTEKNYQHFSASPNSSCLGSRARNEPSRRFHNHGEGPYLTRA